MSTKEEWINERDLTLVRLRAEMENMRMSTQAIRVVKPGAPVDIVKTEHESKHGNICPKCSQRFEAYGRVSGEDHVKVHMNLIHGRDEKVTLSFPALGEALAFESDDEESMVRR